MLLDAGIEPHRSIEEAVSEMLAAPGPKAGGDPAAAGSPARTVAGPPQSRLKTPSFLHLSSATGSRLLRCGA
jgi:hypothetical protein